MRAHNRHTNPKRQRGNSKCYCLAMCVSPIAARETLAYPSEEVSMSNRPLFLLIIGIVSLVTATAVAENDRTKQSLAGTRLLDMDGDIASELVAGVDRFLLRELAASVGRRKKHWQRDFSSGENYQASLASNRERLAHILGVRDARHANTEPRFQASLSQPARVGRGSNYEVLAISWAAFGDVTGRGLMLSPRTGSPVATVIAIPDCSLLPEQLVGLLPGVAPEAQYARRLAENGCRVIVPLLINREERMSKLTNREWLYRGGFEMGRGLIAYEVQKVLALVDWVSKEADSATSIGIMGWGEGGLLSLYAAALDTRIDAAVVSGYFCQREEIWQEPIDRNVFGLLEQFGDAELAAMVAPRPLIVEASAGPIVTIPGGRGAPARLVSPDLDDVRHEFQRAEQIFAGSGIEHNLKLIASENGQGPCGTDATLFAFVRSLQVDQALKPIGSSPEHLRTSFDPQPRHAQQIYELDRHTQHLLRESHYLRQNATMKRFDVKSVEAYQESSKPVRAFFYEEVIGRFANDLLPPNVRTRKFEETEHWIAYEVVLDVFPDVIAYGLLLLPKDLKPGEQRPVVVCQHGLEGRPQDTIGAQGAGVYAAFSGKLAERGFITFAPQNLYIFQDRFRTLQRKANPLKKTLFSIITPQHQQIVDWLQTLDFVDGDRIGFYGLSYGGKTAMRVPALVTDYCLSICSADFNEWVDKNASSRNPRSYINSGEYEIFEFDLGSTFNYAEMAALIAPRPFMVERGHFDGVADDWTVAYEFAKVRNLYAAKLRLGDRAEIEWFVGPHKIHGVATYDFLSRHLNWPENSGE